MSYLPTAQRLTLNIANASNLKYEEVTPELDSFSKHKLCDIYINKNLTYFHSWFGSRKLTTTIQTRFGPKRVAADMERNGEFDFLEISDEFWRFFEKF